jgi:hypothetical protein
MHSSSSSSKTDSSSGGSTTQALQARRPGCSTPSSPHTHGAAERRGSAAAAAHKMVLLLEPSEFLPLVIPFRWDREELSGVWGGGLHHGMKILTAAAAVAVKVVVRWICALPKQCAFCDLCSGCITRGCGRTTPRGGWGRASTSSSSPAALRLSDSVARMAHF